MTDTQTIKDRIDIVQLIQEYVPLKKAGANWKANCPFHHEKSPSFMAHQDKQIWHCFGCGKGGDIFTFLQEMEGLDFPEALKILAERAGVKIDTYQSEVNKSQKNRILEINQKAAYFFYNFLLQMPSAKVAREYLERRALKDTMIKEWQVGFIPEQWNLLTQYLLKKGYSIDDLIASGLTIKREGADVKSGRGFYDRFRGRVMFPIADAHGNIVGFTGRILVEKENSGGKYVNTPQTLVYDKSRALYGLDKAKMEIKSKDLAVIVEGQMDVIACHQAGMKNVVAASGTALTLEQVKLLKRYTNNAAIAFDADSAGENAAKRGIDAALKEGMNVRVIQIPAGAGKDADECLKKEPTVWFRSVKEAKEVMAWYFETTFGKTPARDPQAKQKAASILLAEISKLPTPIGRGHWLKQLAAKLDVEENILREEMRRTEKRTISNSGTATIGSSDNLAAAFEHEKKSVILQEALLALLLKHPKIIARFEDRIKSYFFTEGQFGALYDLLKKEYNESNVAVLPRKKFNGDYNENTIGILQMRADKDYADMPENEASQEVELLLAGLARESIKLRREKLHAELKQAQEEKNESKIREILQKIVELTQL